MTVWCSSYSLMHWALFLGFWSHVIWTHILARMSVCTLPRKLANLDSDFTSNLFGNTILHHYRVIVSAPASNNFILSEWSCPALRYYSCVVAWSHCDLHVYFIEAMSICFRHFGHVSWILIDVHSALTFLASLVCKLLDSFSITIFFELRLQHHCSGFVPSPTTESTT